MDKPTDEQLTAELAAMQSDLYRCMNEISRIAGGVRELAQRLQESPPDAASTSPPTAQQPSERWSYQPTGAPKFELPVATRPTKPSKTTDEMEMEIGTSWLLWIGVVAVVLGVMFFVAVAYQHGYITPKIQVIGAALAGALLIGAGEAVGRKQAAYGRTLIGLGIAVLYMAAYAGYEQHHLYSPQLAVAMMSVITAGAVGFAMRHDSMTLAVLGMVCGYATAHGIGAKPEHAGFFLSYLLVLNAGLIGVALVKRWASIVRLAAVGWAAAFLAWQDAGVPAGMTGVVITHLLINLVTMSAAQMALLREAKDSSERALDLLLVFGLPCTVFFVLTGLPGAMSARHNAGWYAVEFAVYYFAIGLVMRSLRREARLEWLLPCGVGLLFATIAIPAQAHIAWWTAGWSIEALVVTAIGVRERDSIIKSVGWCLVLIACGSYLFDPIFEVTTEHFLNYGMVNSVVIVAMLFGVLAIYQREKASDDSVKGAAIFAGIFSLIALTRITLQFAATSYPAEPMMRDMLLSFAWAVYAATLVGIGFARKSSPLRWTGLALFGVTVGKVVIYDLSELDKLYRAASFIVVGAVLLLVAWVYAQFSKSTE